MAPVTSWSLIQCPARYVSLIVCDLQTLTMRLPRFDLVCCAIEKENLYGTVRWRYKERRKIAWPNLQKVYLRRITRKKIVYENRSSEALSDLQIHGN